MKIILINSKEEWKSLKSIIGKNKQEKSNSPYGKIIKSRLGKSDVNFLHTGAGKTLAAGGAQYSIDKLKADVIFQIGCAGGVSDKLKMLDLVAASKAVQYDYMEGMGNNQDFWGEDRVVKISTNKYFKKLKKLNIPAGAFASADTDMDFEKRKILIRHKKIMCADWESYSVAKVCKLNKIPLLIIKGISDIPQKSGKKADKKQKKDYSENIEPILKKTLHLLEKIIN